MTTEFTNDIIFDIDVFVDELERSGHAFPEILDALYEYLDIVELSELA